MDTKKLQALLTCMANHEISLDDILGYMRDAKLGDLHFSNGAHASDFIPGLVPDGVFINSEYYITANDRIDPVYYDIASNYSKTRDCVLPPPEVRDLMIANFDKLNQTLSLISFPPLINKHYWAEGDSHSKYMLKCVRGVRSINDSIRHLNEEAVALFSGTKVFENLLQYLGTTPEGYNDFLQKLPYYPSAGQYLLRNGMHVDYTVYGQEVGVFVNPNIYLPLEQLQVGAFGAYDAFQFVESNNLCLPEYFELRQIAKFEDVINQSLSAVGKSEYQLHDVKNSYWCKESLESALLHGDAVQRHIVTVKRQNNASNLYIIINDIQSNLKY